MLVGGGKANIGPEANVRATSGTSIHSACEDGTTLLVNLTTNGRRSITELLGGEDGKIMEIIRKTRTILLNPWYDT